MTTAIGTDPNGPRYIATFERIGRNHSVPPLSVVGGPDDIAKGVYRYARQFLGSTWWDVQVDLEAMTGTIEQGRFGRFTLAPA